MGIRDDEQKKALLAWSKTKQGTIAASVGWGKSWLAIEIHKQYREKKVLLVTPTIVLHEKNWKQEYEKMGEISLYQQLDRCCYVSLHKYNPDDYDLVIADESHHIGGVDLEFWKKVNGLHILSLTGTPPTHGEKLLYFNSYFPVVYKYSLEEAAGTIINDYRIIVIECQLDDVNKNIPAGNKTKRFMTTEKKAYAYKTHLVEKALSEGKNTKMPFLMRKLFLDTLPSRTVHSQKIINKFLKNKKSIIFASSIEQAESLCKYTFHSKSKDGEILEKFNTGEISMISSVNVLKEGMTLGKVEAALITKLNSTDTSLQQKTGRALRNDFDKVSDIFILVYTDTVEHGYFKRLTENIDEKKIEKYEIHRL